MPSISVVLPVYNAQHALAEALESILSQTFEDFEVIAVNDGSTDASLDVLRRYASADCRVRVVDQANTGIVGALNEGLRHAACRYVARMDADDVSLPERFEKQVAYLESHPECVALGTGVLMIDPDGLPIGPLNTPGNHAAIDRYNLRHGGGGLVHASAMMRRTAIAALGGYDKRFPVAEDCDFFLRLAELGRLANLPDILYQYRRHPKSITVSRLREMATFAGLAVHEACRRRGLRLPDNLDPKVPRRSEVYRDWVQTSLRHGHFATARKYAWRLVLRNFWFDGSWRLLGAATFSSPHWPPANERRSRGACPAAGLAYAAISAGVAATSWLRNAIRLLRHGLRPQT